MNETVVNMVIEDSQSFTIVEDKGFSEAKAAMEGVPDTRGGNRRPGLPWS